MIGIRDFRSKFHFRDEFQVSNQSLTFVCGQCLSSFFVGTASDLNECLVVFLSFRREVEQKCSPSSSLPLQYESFPEHGLDGSMHYCAIEPKPLGDLVLIKGSVVPQGRKNEAASRGAARFSLQTLPNCEVGSGQMCEDRILENVIGNPGFGDHCQGGTHKKVTAASIGRRHWGCPA